MMADNGKPKRDYEVGHGKPPKEHRFPKNTSGNPRGAPSKRKRTQVDLAGILNEPVKVRTGGKERNMSPFEAGFRQLARRALDNDLRAILKFVKICEEYGIIAPPSGVMGCGVIVAPKGVDYQEWVDSITEEVPDDEV